MTEQTNQDIRTASVSIPLDKQEGVRPSAEAVTRVKWDANASQSRQDQIIAAREQEIAEYHERQKEFDPKWQRIHQLESVVAKQQDQIKLLMEVISKQEAK